MLPFEPAIPPPENQHVPKLLTAKDYRERRRWNRRLRHLHPVTKVSKFCCSGIYDTFIWSKPATAFVTQPLFLWFFNQNTRVIKTNLAGNGANLLQSAFYFPAAVAAVQRAGLKIKSKSLEEENWIREIFLFFLFFFLIAAYQRRCATASHTQTPSGWTNGRSDAGIARVNIRSLVQRHSYRADGVWDHSGANQR